MERITRDNSAVCLIDHQVGLLSGVRDITINELKHRYRRRPSCFAHCSRRSTEPDLTLEIGRSETRAMNAITSRLTHRSLSLSVCKRDSCLRKGAHSATNTETNPRALNADNQDGEMRC